jgi:S1-C subfamily serine protease
MFRSLICLALVIGPTWPISPQQAQQFAPSNSTASTKPLTNADVVEMESLGLSDEVIIAKIHATAETDFDTSIDGLKALKAEKVSDAVLKAMLDPHPNSTPQGGRLVDELSTRFQVLKNGVFTVWSEFGHGTGFLISSDGLVLTNQHVIGPSEYIALQFDEKKNSGEITGL